MILPLWDRLRRRLSIFATSPTISPWDCFGVMTSQVCHAPTMSLLHCFEVARVVSATRHRAARNHPRRRRSRLGARDGYRD